MTSPAIKEIMYRFGDASVPPEYHRSYTVTVHPASARIVVDSYGEIVADRTYEITSEQFQSIVRSLVSNDIRNCTREGDADAGCTGGTTESISYAADDGQRFSGSIHHCGGDATGNLCGDVACFADDVKKLIPALEELLL